MATLQPFVDGGTFFEGPRWHDGAWWVSDFYAHTVSRIDAGGRRETVMEVPGQPSGLGWLPDGSMLVVSMLDQRVLRRWPDGRVTTHADIGHLATGHANDLVVAPDGGAWVGNFGFDLMAGEAMQPACLARIAPDGAVSTAATDLYFPNGAVITPEGRTLIVGETFGNAMTAFSIGADGTLSDRRDWARFGPRPEPGAERTELLRQLAVGPDGCCLDADNHLWVADAFNQRCIRVAPGGAIVDELKPANGQGVFACMLGGDDGRTLLVCVAPDSSARRRKLAPEASLWTARVDVPHAGQP
ncbi:SMP-30/gluconolactonase/LRE family protein [Marinobacter bohaiensis]|uniref:SMP-30/gluconolactonase/LRE family protein n=1 Tax=Marinobacter bohaiensis TaxID=2201898 RepID=UPI000DAE7AD2|nr:SMP-30/gluconolactonase/LRE family protein [Marinobacter bohaiensis]